MAGKQYKEKATIQAEWDGKPLEQGIKRTDAALDRFKKNVGDVGKIMAGAFASQVAMKGLQLFTRGVRELGQQFIQAQKAASDYELSIDRIKARMMGLGQSFDDHADSINAATEAMFRYAGASKGETLDALAQLFNYTGDIDKAMRSLAETFDFMAVTGMGVEQAARNIGMTWEGEMGRLGMMIPALKNYSKEQMAAGEHMKEFAIWAGQATAATNTYQGSIDTLGGQITDLKAALAMPINDALKDGINQLATTIHNLNSSGALDTTKQLIGSIASNVMNAAGSLWGFNGQKGAIRGIEEFLTRLKSYTGGNAFVSDVKSIASGLAEIVKLGGSAAKVINSLFTGDFMRSNPSPAPASPEGFAAGGMIPGMFDGDKIPFIGKGEYIVNPDATRKHKALLDYLNFIDSPSQHSGAGYATGGINYEAFRARFNRAPSIDWITQQLSMGEAGYVNLRTHLSRSFDPQSSAAVIEAMSLIREHSNASTFNTKVGAAEATLTSAVYGGVASASAESRARNAERRKWFKNRFGYDPDGDDKTKTKTPWEVWRDRTPEEIARQESLMMATPEQLYGALPEGYGSSGAIKNYKNIKANEAWRQLITGGLKTSDINISDIPTLDGGIHAAAMNNLNGFGPKTKRKLSGIGDDLADEWGSWNPAARAFLLGAGAYAGGKLALTGAGTAASYTGSFLTTPWGAAAGGLIGYPLMWAMLDQETANKYAADQSIPPWLRGGYSNYGNRSWSSYNPPQFASGGIVPGRRGEKVWVKAEAGEQFTPLSLRDNVPGFVNKQRPNTGPVMAGGEPERIEGAVKYLADTLNRNMSSSDVSEAQVAKGIERLLFRHTGISLYDLDERIKKVSA